MKTPFHHSLPSTHWSAVRQASGADAASRRAALAVFLERYSPALKSYLINRRRLPEDEAEDVVQSFMADKVIEQNLLDRADATRGKFRTFLLTSFVNYWISRLRRKSHSIVTTSAEYVVGDSGPDLLLEAEWARRVVAEALTAMRAECTASGRLDVWQVFQGRMLAPLFSDAESESYLELAERLGLSAPAQAANLLVTAKRMYVRMLRRVVGEYEQTDGEIEEEIVDLRRKLSYRGTRETVLP